MLNNNGSIVRGKYHEFSKGTGIGASGSVLLGMFLFKEPKDIRKLFLVVGIIVSIVGLKLVS